MSACDDVNKTSYLLQNERLHMKNGSTSNLKINKLRMKIIQIILPMYENVSSLNIS